MSANQPQRSNLVQMLLIVAVVFLGFQLLFPNKAPDARNSDEILRSMRELNREGKDVSLAKLVPIYENKIREEKAGKGWTDEQVNEKRMEAHVLLSHTKFKTGLHYAENPALKQHAQPKLMAGWQNLDNLFSAEQGKPLWEKEFSVAGDSVLSGDTFSAGILHTKLVDDLSERNRTQSVWGFPGYRIIDAIVAATGRVPGLSYWLTAFVLALVVRVVVFPLAQKQFMWGRKMQQLQPKIKELQAKHGVKPGSLPPAESQQALQADTMALYKKHGVNPFSGCLPALIQLPLFLFVYQCMLLYRFEFTKGTFLWIAPGAQSVGWMKVAPNLGQIDFPLIFLYGISMVVSQLLMPVSDPSNMRQQRIMGLFVAVIVSGMMFFYPVPSAFILYWLFANVLATVHALYAYRVPMAPLQEVQTSLGGLTPFAETTVDPSFIDKTGANKTGKKNGAKKMGKAPKPRAVERKNPENQ
ncbi:MAG: YidC/Oxa1 family membrane protein insertase [Fimbriimonadaceae bacterium]